MQTAVTAHQRLDDISRLRDSLGRSRPNQKVDARNVNSDSSIREQTLNRRRRPHCSVHFHLRNLLVYISTPLFRSPHRYRRVIANAQFEFHDRSPFVRSDIRTMAMTVAGRQTRLDPLLPLVGAGFPAGNRLAILAASREKQASDESKNRFSACSRSSALHPASQLRRPATAHTPRLCRRRPVAWIRTRARNPNCAASG